MNHKYNIVLLFSFVLCSTSCKVSKDYHRAELNMPKSYRSDTGNKLIENTANQPEPDTIIIHKPHDFFKNTALLSLLDTAFVRNSNLLIAVKNIGLAESVLRTAKLNYLPDINSQINGSYSKSSKNSAVGQASAVSLVSENYNLSLGISWDVDIWGKIKREKEEALANYLQTQEVRKAVQTKLVIDIAKAYYNLLMLDEQLKVARASSYLSDSTLHIVELQYRVGDANLLAIQQVKAQLEQNKVLVSQIEQSIGVQENALSLLCGNYSIGAINRQWANGEEFAPKRKEGYPVYLLSSRPDILAAEYSLKAANARVGISKIAMYPALNISLSGGVNSLTSSSWFSIPASLFGTVAGGIIQPVFNRRKQKSKYEQAIIEREKEVITFRQAVLEGYSQVSDALLNKQKIEEQYDYARNREKVLEESIRSSNQLFKTGMINYLEIINAQSSYLQASLQTVQLNINRALSNIELYYALGGGWQ